MIDLCRKAPLALALTLALGAGAAVAQSADGPISTANTAADRLPPPPAAAAAPDPLAESMATCGRIANVQQRVACYDALNRTANPAASVEEAESRRRNFGLTLPQVRNPFASPAELREEARRAAAARADARVDDGVTQILARLDHARQGPPGQLILVTTEGSVWQLENSSNAAVPPKGSEFLIRRGALGSLFCDIDRWRAVRCKRLQ